MGPERASKARPARVGESLGLDVARSGILYAGVTVFSRLGFSATRVEDLLVEAGIARRTFYRHFRNKEEVLAAIYEYATTELIAAVRAIGKPVDPLGALHRAIDMYFDYFAQNGALAGILVQQAMQPDSPLAPHRHRFRDQLAALADEAVRATTGERNDPMMYLALVSAIEGVSLEMLLPTASARQLERAKAVAHLLIYRALRFPATHAKHNDDG
jgi:AcrR family transcriptional regulator